MSYISGFLAAVPDENKDAYIALAQKLVPLWKKHGATDYRECWGRDVPDGTVTSFPMAVKKKDGETVVFSWIEWPDKETADACMASMQTDAEWTEAFGDMPFDGQRMIFGGFDVIVGGLG
ncbi:MAG: DUF1428 domain-containing protein [Rhodobacteraceae bacterium]|nr:DUF1428 domain-containing protein [Paracoccaceae bacterium]